jgi:hypothetical protein
MSDQKWQAKRKQVRELGAGGQGTTYEVASVTGPAERGVLKLLKREGDIKARGRMAREAVNLKLLSEQGVKVPRLLDHNTQHFNDPNTESMFANGPYNGV